MSMTSAQIVSLACSIAKCPSFTAQAGVLLNTILQDLCQDYDIELARGVYNFNFNSATGTNSGPYTLPADWLRARNKDVFYTILGVAYPMIKVEINEYDWFVQQAGIQSFPAYFTTDMSQSPPVMFVWVPPSGSFPVTARYYRQMPDITTPEISSTVPWFPNSQYLVTRLAGELMKITNDDRVGQYLGCQGEEGGMPGAAYILKKYLQMQGDRDDVPYKIELDRRRFGLGANYTNLPSTKTIGW